MVSDSAQILLLIVRIRILGAGLSSLLRADDVPGDAAIGQVGSYRAALPAKPILGPGGAKAVCWQNQMSRQRPFSDYMLRR
jgi:hypothetical protein